MKTIRLVAASAATVLLPLVHAAPATSREDSMRPEVQPEVSAVAEVVVGTTASAAFHGLTYFSGRTDATGYELWVTDGTPVGTHLVAEVAPGSASASPDHLVVLGDRLYFTANGGGGNEWWSTDGTASGTVMAVDIFTGPGSSTPTQPTLVGNRLYFTAYEPVHGRELWVTDGNPGGTTIAADVLAGAESSSPRELTSLGDRLVYSASAPEGVGKPWVTIPGRLGAVRLDVELPATDLNPSFFARLGSRVVFAAGNAASGEELWVTGGFPGDAHGVRDIFPGPVSSNPSKLTTTGDRVLFQAATPETGYELWSTDGTTQGTVLVKDIAPRASSFPDQLVVLGDQVLFSAEDVVHGRELWTSRGTPESTRLVVDGYPGPASGLTSGRRLGVHTVAGQMLYSSTDGSGAEPWVTDGTPAGTRRIADLAPGLAGSAPRDVGTVGNTVLFATGDATAGRMHAWTAVGSTCSATVRKSYSARQARRKRIVVPVSVTSTLGGLLDGGTVTLTRNGKDVGTATLHNGRARVRISARLRPGRTHRILATWSGAPFVATGSVSAEVRFRVKAPPRR
jgi:ELWxxDGT repeat protein